MKQSELKEEVKKFRIVYEVAKADAMVGDERRAIGFDLTLCGTHGEEAGPVLPGCPECAKVWRAMQEVARTILPTGEHASWYEIGGFDHAFHMAPAREFRQDIEMPIRIRHREGYLEDIDQCERDCLDEMKLKLEQLGVHQGKWS
jgi:hypothetical protein